MIGIEDSVHTYEYNDYYKILPAINEWSKDSKRIGKGIKVSSDFTYSSDKNNEWMTVISLKKWIAENKECIGKT